MRSLVRRFSHSQSKIEARSWYECLKNDHAILTAMTDGSPVKDVQPDDFMPTFSIIEKKLQKRRVMCRFIVMSPILSGDYALK